MDIKGYVLIYDNNIYDCIALDILPDETSSLTLKVVAFDMTGVLQVLIDTKDKFHFTYRNRD